ncbi:hypothetical protein SBA5_200004 [Candidatus Sulfotelmatomonas gaucii]|uniref:Uncharacterized protein n=1 Tax=Candidatus Sulfuritelmatomonas gaucii TaxID=2043161 RepID=A0A2N9L719_9BACT|nr:hypothetical protein SBA5_200004 [Candidatus Sulfotelmatomonas gaucii]
MRECVQIYHSPQMLAAGKSMPQDRIYH